MIVVGDQHRKGVPRGEEGVKTTIEEEEKMIR